MKLKFPAAIYDKNGSQEDQGKKLFRLTKFYAFVHSSP